MPNAVRILCREDEADPRAGVHAALDGVRGSSVAPCAPGGEDLEGVDDFKPGPGLVVVMMPGGEIAATPGKAAAVIFLTARHCEPMNLARQFRTHWMWRDGR